MATNVPGSTPDNRKIPPNQGEAQNAPQTAMRTTSKCNQLAKILLIPVLIGIVAIGVESYKDPEFLQTKWELIKARAEYCWGNQSECYDVAMNTIQATWNTTFNTYVQIKASIWG